MRKYLIGSSLLIATWGLATPASSLERVAVPANRDDPGGWDTAATCTVIDASTGTGWLWVWSGRGPTEIAGVIFEPCCEGGALVATQAYFWIGCPTG